MNKIRNIFIVVLLLFPFDVFSQDTIKALHTSYLKLVQIEQGNSYMTAPLDIGNIENLVFEGNLIPNFIVRENDKAHLMMVLTTQLRIRMYDQRSAPIKTPSYLPHLSLFYSFGNPSEHKIKSVFIRYGHHSNGQDGPTVLPNGTINLESGNFTTNYFELGGIRAFKVPSSGRVFFIESSFKYHLKKHTEKAILGKYSLYRWNNRFSVLSPPAYFKKKGSFQFDVNINWQFGDVNDWSFSNSKRLSTELTFYYSPKFLEEIGFFIKYYQGMDYYNIYFNRHLSILRFGIMTELLRF